MSMPANILTPTHFANEATQLFDKAFVRLFFSSFFIRINSDVSCKYFVKIVERIVERIWKLNILFSMEDLD